MLKADTLRQTEVQSRQVESEVRQILLTIDKSIKTAHEEGGHEILYTLPLIFNIPNMNNVDAQRHIYFGVLKSLHDRKFSALIIPGGESMSVTISWLSDEEKQATIKKNEYLAQFTQRNT